LEQFFDKLQQRVLMTVAIITLAALTLIVLMWRIGWAHNNARK